MYSVGALNSPQLAQSDIPRRKNSGLFSLNIVFSFFTTISSSSKRERFTKTLHCRKRRATCWRIAVSASSRIPSPDDRLFLTPICAEWRYLKKTTTRLFTLEKTHVDFLYFSDVVA